MSAQAQAPAGDLELGLIGNCTINALIDRRASIVWSCFPRFDDDLIFCRLLDEGGDKGLCSITLEDHHSSEQGYLHNTAVLRTVLRSAHGAAVEVIDFCPRFEQFERMYRPTMIVRIIRPLSEAPRVTIRMRPVFDYGETTPLTTRGSNHIRYVDGSLPIRLSTTAPVTYILDEKPFHLDGPVVLFIGPDESFRSGLVQTADEFLDRTIGYWRQLSGRLHIPFEWQDAVIRSAITLKLCSFEETGAIIAAPTSSLPEADGEGRNWDYRYCWLRDAFFVVRALNRLGYIETMEDYLRYLNNLVANSEDGYLQPVYGIGLEPKLLERTLDTLSGYRHNRPIRIGNQAFEHDQHDGYGSVILAATQAFFDTRLRRPAGLATFRRLERLGEQAWNCHNVPDAGLWEFRTKARIHTHSSVMCWAACDRLRRIAAHLGLADRASFWGQRADHIRGVVEAHAWNERLNSFVAAFDGDDVDASLLLLEEVGFLSADDPRFAGTVALVERELRDGPFVFRYRQRDDFGKPENAFLVCSYWYVDALISLGRKEEARAIFEELLTCRNDLGLLSEHVDQDRRTLWGNFPQTYSHVGLINAAMRLSRRWQDII